MPRSVHTQPISPKLYRHFAVVTVFVTVGVAILADGSGSAAIGEAVEQRQAQNAISRAEQEKLGEKRVGALRDARKARPAGSFGSDPMLPEDTVIETASSLASYPAYQSVRNQASFPSELPPLVPPGLSADVLRPPEAAGRTIRKGPTPEERRRLEELSRLRSGVGDE